MGRISRMRFGCTCTCTCTCDCRTAAAASSQQQQHCGSGPKDQVGSSWLCQPNSELQNKALYTPAPLTNADVHVLRTAPALFCRSFAVPHCRPGHHIATDGGSPLAHRVRVGAVQVPGCRRGPCVLGRPPLPKRLDSSRAARGGVWEPLHNDPSLQQERWLLV